MRQFARICTVASQSALEVETLHQVVLEMLGSDSPLDFDHALPLYSDALTDKQIESIQRLLEQKLVHLPGRHVPVVTPIPAVDEGQAPVLRVRFLGPYLKEHYDEGWYVDVPTDACWYFMTANERSAVDLCRYWNTPRNREYLESVRHEVGVERATLRLCLLRLRDSGIQIKKFGYKSDGIFEDL